MKYLKACSVRAFRQIPFDLLLPYMHISVQPRSVSRHLLLNTASREDTVSFHFLSLAAVIAAGQALIYR